MSEKEFTTPPIVAGTGQPRHAIAITGPWALISTGALFAIGVFAGVVGSWTTGAISTEQFRTELMIILCAVCTLLVYAGLMWLLDRRAEERHQRAQSFLVGQYAALARQVRAYEQTAELAAAKLNVDVEEIIRQASAAGYLRGVQARLGGGGGGPRFGR